MNEREWFEVARHAAPSDRCEAVRRLGMIGSPEALESLAALLADPEPTVANASANCLIEIGGAAAARSVVPLLSDLEAHLRSRALNVLLNLGQAAGSTMESLLDHPDRELRKTAAEVLCHSGYQPAVPALIRHIADPDPLVRAPVAEALAGLQSHEATPDLLLRWPEETDTWARFALAGAICELGSTPQVEALLPGLPDNCVVREMVVAELELRRGRESA